MIHEKNTIITIVWNLLDSYAVDAFSKTQKSDTRDHIEHILQHILGLRSKSGKRHLVIHADNATPHTTRRSQIICEVNSIRIAPHPPYSKDLAS
jgi:hypothetical protein